MIESKVLELDEDVDEYRDEDYVSYELIEARKNFKKLPYSKRKMLLDSIPFFKQFEVHENSYITELNEDTALEYLVNENNDLVFDVQKVGKKLEIVTTGYLLDTLWYSSIYAAPTYCIFEWESGFIHEDSPGYYPGSGCVYEKYPLFPEEAKCEGIEYKTNLDCAYSEVMMDEEGSTLLTLLKHFKELEKRLARRLKYKLNKKNKVSKVKKKVK